MKKNIFIFFVLLINFSWAQHTYFDQGVKSFKEGNVTDAIEYYTLAIKRDHSSNAYFNRGISYYQIDKSIEAIEDFTIVIDKDPLDADAWYNRGLAYYKTGATKKAFFDSKKALKLDTSYHKAYTTIGLCYYSLEKYDEAFENLNIALGFNKSALLYYNRGLTYLELEENLKAEEDFTKAINIEDKVDYYWARANLFHDNEDYKISIEDYSSAIEKDSTMPSLYFNRGLSFYADFQLEKALKDFKKTIELNENDIDAKWYATLCNYESEDYEKALYYYQEVEKDDISYEFLSQIDKKELVNKTKIGNNLWYVVFLIFLLALALFFYKILYKKE